LFYPLTFRELELQRLYDIELAEETAPPNLFDLMDKNYRQEGIAWANVRASNATEANSIAFSSSGWLDALYIPYVGYDAKGNIVSVVIDFFVMSDPYDDEID
jgi:Protein of unknown function (DUF4241)